MNPRRCWPGLLLLLVLPMAAFSQERDDIVKWSGKIVPEKVRAGGKATAVLTGTILPGWHLYSVTQAPGGPNATTVSLPAGQALQGSGPVTGPHPETVYDKNFEMNTEFYENSVQFNLPLLIKAGTPAGAQRARIDVRFQSCNDRICMPPTTVHLEAPVTIVQ